MVEQLELFPIEREHILGLSGGKDSAALAIYQKKYYPAIWEQIKLFTSDSENELKETYEYLERLENYLDKPIHRVSARDINSIPAVQNVFDYFLHTKYNGYLPSPNARWCTRELKIKPMEAWMRGKKAITYIGIRADEDRGGYWQSNIKPAYPFINDKIDLRGVMEILNESGLGIPEYYRWRTRSGCYLCFYQRRIEWLGLHEHHPDLFNRAAGYEKGEFTWIQGMRLEEIPKRAETIRSNHEKRIARVKDDPFNVYSDIFRGMEYEECIGEVCPVCFS